MRPAHRENEKRWAIFMAIDSSHTFYTFTKSPIDEFIERMSLAMSAHRAWPLMPVSLKAAVAELDQNKRPKMG